MPERSVHPYALGSLLAALPSTAIAQIARRLGAHIGGREQKRELIGRIEDIFDDPSAIYKQMQDLPEEHRLVLLGIATAGDGRTGSFSRGRTSSQEENLRRICRELAERGWLFPDPGFYDYGYGGERGYVVPFDLRAEYAEAATFALESKERVYRYADQVDGVSAGPELLSALVRIVGAVAAEPLRLTQQGTVYRRDIERLRKVRGKSQFVAASPAWARIAEELGRYAWRLSSAPWEEEGWEIGLPLWLGLALGLLEEGDGGLRAAKDAIPRLAAAGREELWRSAVLSLMELLINAHSAALALFRLIDVEDWFLPLRWIDDITRARLPLPALEAQCAAAACLLALGELGAAEATMFGEDPGVRMALVGAAVHANAALPEMPLEETFRVLPSGDVLVTPYLAPHLQLALERYARPSKVDVVSTYRIEQGRVVLEASGGTPPEEILDFFERHAMDGLPQPVRFRLEEWLEGTGRVEFLEVALIACDTPEMRDRVLSLPGMRKQVLDLLGDRWLVVDADKEEQLRAALQEGGVVPLREVRRPSNLRSGKSLRRTRQAAASYLGKLGTGVGVYGHPLGTRGE